MGISLFEREGRRLILTDAGRRVLVYANDIFARGEELEALLRRGVEPEAQILNVGILNTLSRNFIDGLIGPLLENPHLTISLQSENLDSLLDGLSKHQLDIALTDADVRGGDQQIWQSQLLARQPVSIVGLPELKPKGKFPRGYQDMQWVVPTRHHDIRRAFEGHCARRPTKSLTPSPSAAASGRPHWKPCWPASPKRQNKAGIAEV